MNRCPNCAAQNREGAKFCTSCGFRLPADAAPVMTNGRSPFSTTSTMPPYADQLTEAPKSQESTEESGFATWNSEHVAEPVHGLSWDAAPPPNTSVPVNDEMIASLIGDAESPAESTQVGAEPSPASARSPETAWAAVAPPVRRETESTASIDHLLTLARELEYGLMELGDAPVELAQIDSRLLVNTLADLQDEDDLIQLRNAVATAQERPRDVDVMLDLVLRADAIATLLTERDQLKTAIELVVHGAAQSSLRADGATTEGDADPDGSDEPLAELPADVEESRDEPVAGDEESQSI